MIQSLALEILKTGANVFLTGEPGAGKTYVLNEYIDWLIGCGIPVAVAASTGIAATHIGGTTIHSWSGIGARDSLTPYDLDSIASNEKTVKRVQKPKVLVIDEISMLDGRVLDMVETVCRTIKQRGESFGGMQVIVVGDFFQLPPIAGRGEMSRFAFESRAWDTAKFLTCYLTEQHRQEDELLLGLLASIRKNDIDESHYTLLSEQTDIAFPDIEPTKLFTHNSDVENMNTTRLKELDTQARVYTMVAKGNKQHTANLVKNCLSPEVLELRKEAMVMCTKNNFEVGYVNGTLGRVVDFDSEDGLPIIETSDGRTIKMVTQTWSVMNEAGDRSLAEISQIPLRLAWAITVHKSQGMSLDAAEIDLRNAFTYGQGYVALSRVRSLQGMKVIGLNSQALLVDPRVVHKDEHFRSDSEDAEEAFNEMDEEEALAMQRNFVSLCGGKIDGGSTMKRAPYAAKGKQDNTYEQTKVLLLKKLNASDIAKERQMALSTIWSHIEKLADQGEIQGEHLHSLIPPYISWEQVFPRISDAIKKCGIEKLKPIYEELGEEYDYDIIRLGRIIYSAQK
ncbi:MAG: AAA family ATPase [Candidatus Pacebacteria bacterium]|nr:AAA family ATPase [Candidatus Paceibacterota bacterium]MCF7857135.1 AAA family ATPase [Candidatus Paceibacterota bacterium]